MSKLIPLLSLAFAVCLTAADVPREVREPFWKSKPGPWGELEIRTAYLEAPDSLLAVSAKPNSATRWTFEQMSEGAVRDLLVASGLGAELIEKLMSPGRRVSNAAAVTLYPTVEELVSLSMDARSKLYVELAKHPVNEFQRDPVFIVGQDLEDWLATSNLNAEQRDLFRKLIWKRGEATVFSDISALLALARNQDEVQAVFRSVTRVRTLIVSLRLPVTVPRREFLEYWSGGRPESLRLPFLSAITSRRAEQSIDISNFLPSLMRQKIYT
ncbi:MAG: hypothetical protein ACKOQ9_04920, partial [Verrucomicrobiota bacterium]